MQRNCGQNSQQILNWFAGEKQTENAGERNMNVKRAVHALIHTNTQPHTSTHRHIHMQMVLLPLCVVVVFPLFSPLRFFFSSFGYATVYWYYYGTMLCNICKFLLLLPTTVFPEFPQLAALPSPTMPLSIPSAHTAVPFSQC